VVDPNSPIANSARRQAQQILSRPPYRPRSARTVRPFAGMIHDVGQWLDDIAHPVGHWLDAHVFGAVGRGLHGWWPYVVGLVAVGAGVLAGWFLVRRRARTGGNGVAPLRSTGDEDPDELDRLADEAERRGDNDRAVRLRFRSGLVRLERQGVIFHRDVLTTRQLARDIPSTTFNELARDLETIVYAGEPATSGEVDAARNGWPHVLAEVRRPESGGSP
jgi:hypothetical protein